METYHIVIGIILAVWLSTLRIYEPPSGELSTLRFFKWNIMVLGIDIPDVRIDPKRFNVPGKNLQIKVDGKRPIYVLIYPLNIAIFSYRYKKFRTLKEVEETGADLRWEPLIPKDEKTKKPIADKNDPKTIVLAEWKEPRKKTLFVLEREDVVFPFLTKDGYRGVAFGYMKYITWNMAAAISNTYQFKNDPEKAALDKFQKWTRGVDYLTKVYGVSFDELPEADEFYQDINAENYISGAILQGIEFTDFKLDPESQDLLEEQENIKKASIKLQAATITAKVVEKEGEGLKNRQKQIADGESYAITKKGSADNTVKITLDKSLKANETLQYKQKQQIERENDVKEYRAKKQIDLSNNSKLLTKIGSLKRIPEKTYVEMQKLKYAGLGKLTNLSTLILHEDTKPESPGSTIDEMLEANIVSNQIVHPSKAIANEKK